MKELIQSKESTRYTGLFVKKYARRVFYDNLWHENNELLEARGHVETADGKVVIRPFTKIFNRGENGTDIDRDEDVVAVRKVNGFMACATYVPEVDEVVVSTTGSLDSDFVEYAELYITNAVKENIRYYYGISGPVTLMFEIVHPEDPHIIQEEFGAYLIGMRPVELEAAYFSNSDNEDYLDVVAETLNVKRPEWSACKFSQVVESAKTCFHEGFVVYGQESKTALKIKSPFYLTLKAAARKKDIMSLNKQMVDEEFYDLIDHIKANQEMFNSLDEQARLEYMKQFLLEESV